MALKGNVEMCFIKIGEEGNEKGDYGEIMEKRAGYVLRHLREHLSRHVYRYTSYWMICSLIGQ